MNRVLAASAMIGAAAVLLMPSHAANAQVLQNSKIEINYEVPKTEAHRAIHERLKKREVLEQLKQFLSPVRLPKRLALQTADCGVVNAFYAKSKGLILCYEY